MSKDTGLVLAGLVAAGIGAYFLLGRKPAAAATGSGGGGSGGGGSGGGGSGGGGSGGGDNASTFKKGDAVRVTGYYSSPVVGHISEVLGGGRFTVHIDDFGTDIPATVDMLTKVAELGVRAGQDRGLTWTAGDFVLVTGHPRFPGGVNGVIDRVNSDGTYRIRITIWDDTIGANIEDFIIAQSGMLS